MIILDMRDRLAHELTAAVVTLRLGSNQLEFGMQVRQLTSSPHRGGTVAGGELQGPHSLLFLIVSLALKLQCSPWPRVNFVFFAQIFSACPGIDSSASVQASAVIPRIPNYGVTVLLGSSWFPLVRAASSPDLGHPAHFSVRLHLWARSLPGHSPVLWHFLISGLCLPVFSPRPEDPCSHPQGVGMTLVPLPHQWAPWGQDERCASWLCI